MSCRRRWDAGAFALMMVLGGAPRAVFAHGLDPGVLRLVETRPGVFTMAWTEPVDTRNDRPLVEVGLPPPCRRTADVVDCGPDGLRGTIAFPGLERQGGRVVVSIAFLDGTTVEALVGADDPELPLDRAPGRSLGAWLALGVEHIVGGLDHLAFLAGLLLVVGARHLRRLVATITAFTVAHSATFALAAGGLLTLRAAPVEATIAASVVLVAREGLRDRATLTRRAPWVVALVFGLVHGLGFAGALAQMGLPPGWQGWSLLGFNLGVELGQLALVIPVVVLARRLGPGLAAVRMPACYVIGGLGAYWLVGRTLAIVGP